MSYAAVVLIEPLANPSYCNVRTAGPARSHKHRRDSRPTAMIWRGDFRIPSVWPLLAASSRRRGAAVVVVVIIAGLE